MRLFILFLSFFFYSCGFAKLNTEWWKHTIIYEIIPYTFKDSDGDGIGDFKGIMSKLDHFVDLGIETIHLMPMYKTSLRDMGYDISDYYDVEPRLGTMEDFEELVKQMKKRNMKLILDLVINHSGHQHEWFQKSIDRIYPYTDFYIWKDPKYFNEETQEKTTPNNWRSIFTIDELGSAWTWNEKRQQYYFHQFLPEQPDFDLNNKILKKELKKMIKFWLDKGVAGFRLDATPFFFEDEEFRDGGYNERQLNQPETLEFIHEFRLWLDQYNKIYGGDFERIFIAEAHADDDIVVQYYDKPDYPITHLPYTFMFEHFHHAIGAQTLYDSIQSWMNMSPKGAVPAWMTQDHDGSRVGSRIIPEYADLFTMLTMMLPGTVGVYYGQEIAMENGVITEDQIKDFSGGGTRDPARLLMQWDDSINAGFSTHTETFLPPNSDYFYKNVEIQKAQRISHYNMFKDLSTLRKTNSSRYGDFNHYAFPSLNMYIMKRSVKRQALTVVVNFGASISCINLQKMFDRTQNQTITVAAVSTNAGYSTGYILNPKLGREFCMRPYSSIVFQTIFYNRIPQFSTTTTSTCTSFRCSRQNSRRKNITPRFRWKYYE